MAADRLTVAVSLCVLNTASNRLSVRVNVVFLFAKLLALAIIIVGGVVAFATGQSWTCLTFLPPLPPPPIPPRTHSQNIYIKLTSASLPSLSLPPTDTHSYLM